MRPDGNPLKMSLVRAASIFGLLALFFAWMGTTGNAGIAVTVAKLFFFLCLIMFLALLTFAIIGSARFMLMRLEAGSGAKS
jgi:uncharacterized membrane protein YtjA (UPF0391 family)